MHNKYLPGTAIFVLAAIALFSGYGFFVSAAAPSGGYVVGSTLDPDCAPGESDCRIDFSTAVGWEANPTGGPLGTGLTVSNYVLGIGTEDPQNLIHLYRDDIDMPLGMTIENYNPGSSSAAMISMNNDAGLAGALATYSSNYSDPKLAGSLGLFAHPNATGIRLWDSDDVDGQGNIKFGIGAYQVMDIRDYRVNIGLSETIDPYVGDGMLNVTMSDGRNLVIFGTSTDTEWSSGTETKYLFGSSTLRMGSVSDSAWNESNRGSGSIAIGFGFSDVNQTIPAPLASGVGSTAIGQGIQAVSGRETVLGSFNTAYSPVDETAWFPDDRLFTIGNGSELGSESDALTILKNGLTGIGFDNFETASSSALLQVNGPVLQTGATSCDLVADADGVISCAPSDRNLKNNIEGLSSGLLLVNQLRPVTYTFKDSRYGTGSQVGFIAQELESVLPEVVTSGPDYKSVNYGLITPVLVKAVQELDLRLSDIETRADDNNSFGGMLLDWFASATNGITDLFTKRVHTEELCIGMTCVTESQLQQLLQGQSSYSSNDPGLNEDGDDPAPDSPAEPVSNEDGATVEVSMPEVSEPETPAAAESVSPDLVHEGTGI